MASRKKSRSPFFSDARVSHAVIEFEAHAACCWLLEPGGISLVVRPLYFYSYDLTFYPRTIFKFINFLLHSLYCYVVELKTHGSLLEYFRADSAPWERPSGEGLSCYFGNGVLNFTAFFG